MSVVLSDVFCPLRCCPLVPQVSCCPDLNLVSLFPCQVFSRGRRFPAVRTFMFVQIQLKVFLINVSFFLFLSLVLRPPHLRLCNVLLSLVVLICCCSGISCVRGEEMEVCFHDLKRLSQHFLEPSGSVRWAGLSGTGLTSDPWDTWASLFYKYRLQSSSGFKINIWLQRASGRAAEQVYYFIKVESSLISRANFLFPSE